MTNKPALLIIVQRSIDQYLSLSAASIGCQHAYGAAYDPTASRTK